MFKALLTLFAFIAASSAQGVLIVQPTANQAVKSGSNLTIQIDRPYFPVDSEEVAIAIGFQTGQFSSTNGIGTILYNGPYQPEVYKPFIFPYENFTVQVPSSTPSGAAVVTVVHLSLITNDHLPFFETVNQTITVE